MALEKIRPRVVDATGDYTFNNVTATGSILTANANIGNITGVTNLVSNTTTITVTGNLTTTANVSAGNIKTDNLLYANGNPWSIGASSTPPGGSTTQVQFNDAGGFGGSSNFTFNKSTNTLAVNYISGNGSQLSGLVASNINGQVSNSLVSSTVYTNAQPNITSLGTLTSLDVTSNITGGNANLGNATVSNYFIGNGSLLSSIAGGNVTGQVGYAAVANSVSGSNVVGQVTYAATANAVAGANVLGTVAQSTYAGTANSVSWSNISSKPTTTSGFGITDSYSNTNAGAYLTAYTGNSSAAYFVGNGYYLTGVDQLSVGNADGANFIANGTSNINTPISGGNITVGIGGTSNTVVFTSTGINVAGYANISSGITTAGTITLGSGTGGNLTGANVLSATTIIASANLTAGNIAGGNLISANYISGNGYLLTGISAGSATSVVNGNSNISIVANSNASINIAGISNVVVITSTGINLSGYINATKFVGEAGNVSNIQGANVSGNVTSAIQTHYANIANSVAGSNVSGSVAQATYAGTANSVAGANVSGNVTSAIQTHYANIANSVAGSNVSGSVAQATYAGTANSVAGANVSGTVATATNAGTVTTAAQPNITSVGSLTGLTVSNVTGVVNFTTTANVTLGSVSNLHISGGTLGYVLSTDGSGTLSWVNASGGYSNTNAAAYLSTHTGNLTAGNANLGNAVVANYFVGSGAYLTGVDLLSVGNSDTANRIANGTSNIDTVVSGGNITVGIGGTSNTVIFTSTGVNVAGTLNVGGNAIVGNLTVTGTTTTVNSTITRVVDPIMELGGGANAAALTTDDNKDRGLLLHYYSGSAIVDAFMGWDDSNGEFGVGSNVSVTNEVVTWNSYGNIRAANFIGNGAFLTGVGAASAGFIINGTSNVNIPTGSGNVTTSVGGTSNVVIVTSTGVNVAGYINTGTSNVTANYFIGNGALLTGLDAAGRVVNGTSNISIPITSGNVTFGVNGTGNVVIITSTGIVVTGSGSISAASGAITGGTLTGPLTTAAQPNITSLGTLTSLTVSGNANVGNINTGGNVYANSGVVKGLYIYGDGSNLTGLGGAGYIFNGTSNVNIPSSGANVYFTVGLTANIMTVASTGINVAGYANVTGNAIIGSNLTSGNANLGNLATANYFSGNFYGTANNASTVTTAAQPNITSLGTLANLTVTGPVNLGAIGNLTITGGASGYFLKTDGSGGLSWAVPAGGGGGGTSLTYTADTTPPGTGNILGDQWFNTTSNVLYEYINDGSASYWVDISGATTTATAPTSLNLANVLISGGTSGQALVSNGSGGLSFTTLTSNIFNGNSNVVVSANSNVRFSIAGIANVLTITNSSANLISTGSANLGNSVTANYVTGTLTTASQPNITTVGTLANLTVSGLTTYGLSADILVTKTGATGTVTHDVSAGAVFYHTSPSANFTANFTNVSTTTDRVLTVTLLISQGATPYMCTAVQIDSFAQTIKWIGGVTATGSASKLDIVSFSLLRTGGSWIVTGQSAYYG